MLLNLSEPSDDKIILILPPPARRGANYIPSLIISVRERS
jgi:hypothetical protein